MIMNKYPDPNKKQLTKKELSDAFSAVEATQLKNVKVFEGTFEDFIAMINGKEKENR